MGARVCPNCSETGNLQATNDRFKCLNCGTWFGFDGKVIKHKARGGATYMTSQSHLTIGEEVGD